MYPPTKRLSFEQQYLTAPSFPHQSSYFPSDRQFPLYAQADQSQRPRRVSRHRAYTARRLSSRRNDVRVSQLTIDYTQQVSDQYITDWGASSTLDASAVKFCIGESGMLRCFRCLNNHPVISSPTRLSETVESSLSCRLCFPQCPLLRLPLPRRPPACDHA